jgi:hypothetical protein
MNSARAFMRREDWKQKRKCGKRKAEIKLGQQLSKSQHKIRLMKFGAARFFQRHEDDQPPQTPADSPFRRFTVSCLKCGSFKLQVIGEFDSDADKSFRDLTFNSFPRSRRRGNSCSARPAGLANKSLRTATILRTPTIKTVRPVSGFFPAMPGRDFAGPQASHRRATRQVVPPAG